MKTSIQTGIAWTLTLLGVVIILETNWQAHAGSTISKYKSYICAWWAAGANTQDSLGKHNGSLENGTGYLPGIRGMAFNFNGWQKIMLRCHAMKLWNLEQMTSLFKRGSISALG